MQQFLRLCTLVPCLIFYCHSQAQTADDKIVSKFLSRITRRTKELDDQITGQSIGYLDKIGRIESRVTKKMPVLQPAAAQSFPAASTQQLESLKTKLISDTSRLNVHLSGEYRAYTDSIQSMLRFLKNKTSLQPQISTKLEDASHRFDLLQAKMQNADQIKVYIRSRRAAIGEYIKQHTEAARVLGSQYKEMGRHLYYYSQQLRHYKEALNDPDKIEKEALDVLRKVPAFQDFMKQNSQLAGFFGLPPNYASSEALVGLQTKDLVAATIQARMGNPELPAGEALQPNLKEAQTQLGSYKSKLSQLGSGSGDIDMPDFKPNDQKTRAFWRRLEYGTNFQTTHNSYYFPTTSDFGFSVGYKLNNHLTAGIGGSYKLGWGNGINHVSFSNQGIGIRSFFDLNIKASFFASGGFEYNHRSEFRSLQQLSPLDQWTRSGLIGVSKIVSMKSRAFKKTKASLLWDFLSYQQVSRTQAIIWRIGYTF